MSGEQAVLHNLGCPIARPARQVSPPARLQGPTASTTLPSCARAASQRLLAHERALWATAVRDAVAKGRSGSWCGESKNRGPPWLSRALAADSVSRREVLARALGGFVGAALLDPLAAVGAKRRRRCTPGHASCAEKCCPPEELCGSVHRGRHLLRKCACPKPKEICSGACKDLARDINHCGACGHRCAKGQLPSAAVSRLPPGVAACRLFRTDAVAATESPKHGSGRRPVRPWPRIAVPSEARSAASR
jgi:hypothetical protein